MKWSMKMKFNILSVDNINLISSKINESTDTVSIDKEILRMLFEEAYLQGITNDATSEMVKRMVESLDEANVPRYMEKMSGRIPMSLLGRVEWVIEEYEALKKKNDETSSG